MSHDELRTEYERLRAQIVQFFQSKPLSNAESSEAWQLLEKLQVLTQEYDQKLSEAEAQIAELKRELFGPKADKLTPEQEEQLQALNEDLQQEAQRPAPVSDQILEREDRGARRRRQRRRGRHGLPDHLEAETVIIEPDAKVCVGCGKPLQRIGEEVSEEIDLIPAQLIRRRTIRPKYACRCGEVGVKIAPLPPRLIPQSRLGLGLATHILLSRFDDHLSFYRLEQQFRERHGIIIPRQQMIQWTEQMAFWLQPVYDAMWRQMLAGGYLQVDETPVRVLDPEVAGKAARGYLWFYAVPHGDVILDFDRSRALKVVQQRLKDFRGTIQTDAVENSIRPSAVGKRRWLFIGHPDAGWRSAVIYSIMVSCRRRGINPQDYVTDVLRRLPTAKTGDIQDLLPANWKPPTAASG